MAQQVEVFLSDADIKKWYSVKDLQAILAMPRSTVQEQLSRLRKDKRAMRRWDGQRWRYRRTNGTQL